MKRKKKLVIILCLVTINLLSQGNIVTVSQQANNTITIDFTLPEYSIADTNILEVYGINRLYNYIKTTDFEEIADVGYPGLPYFTVDINVPKDASNLNVSLTNSAFETQILNRRILPVQEDIVIDGNMPAFSISESYYNSDGSLFSFSSAFTDEYIIMGYKGISFSIFPFKYNPSTNNLTVIKSGRFTITYSSSQLKNSTVLSDISNDYLKGVFQNYSGSSLKSGSTVMGTYLIITPSRYETILSDFVNHKRDLGYLVNVVNTNTTGTTADNIKAYIKSQYNSASRPDFVLLVGDITDIPASGGNASGTEIDDPLTDLWYAAIDGGDYFADLFLGRFSVSSETELRDIIRKTIQMDNNLQSYTLYAAFLAGGGDYQSSFDNGHNRAINGAFEPAGYTCEKIYAKDGATQQQALDALKNNPVFYIYSGHGSFTSWGTPFENMPSYINLAANTVYPFVFAFACKTGNYGYSIQNIGESWIRSNHGGVSYFGSSVSSLVNSDKKMEKEILRDAFTECKRLSPMINLGMKKYYNDKWSVLGLRFRKRYMQAYNLLGDPSLFYQKDCIENIEFTSNTEFNSGEIITYYASNTITAPKGNVSVAVNPLSTVTFIAGNTVKLNPGFYAKSTSYFHASIANFCSAPTLKSVQISDEKAVIALTEKDRNYGPDNADAINLRVFPNPVKNELKLYMNLGDNEKVQVEIYNTTGRLTYSEQYNTDEISINLNNYPSGLYILRVIRSGTSYKQKFIKE